MCHTLVYTVKTMEKSTPKPNFPPLHHRNSKQNTKERSLFMTL